MPTPYQGKTILISGMFFKKKAPNAPAWVKGKVLFKLDEFSKFVKSYKEGDKSGWMSADLKESKEGKLYFALNTYKPKQEKPEKSGDKIYEELGF